MPENHDESSLVSSLAVIGLIIGIFLVLYGLIADRAQSLVTKFFAFWTALLIEFIGVAMLYDSEFCPLKSGLRWPGLEKTLILLGVIYVILLLMSIREFIHARNAERSLD